ncbi:hypothetical protein [Candidatus Leptofilum sp.]|uniref:hypothetical protein n=1 Tax=Candidatus Leptofilum sp. TaxID=3241576 RepID=UPI003B5CBCF5
MEPSKWDYCTIVFRTYHNVGGSEHAGLNYGLLWFEAEAKGVNGRYAAGKSNEIPFGRIAEGVPDSGNAAHVNVHQDLMNKLRQDGWEPVSGGGSGWWEKRFRRDASKAPQSFLQKVRSYFSKKNNQ